MLYVKSGKMPKFVRCGGVTKNRATNVVTSHYTENYTYFSGKFNYYYYYKVSVSKTNSIHPPTYIAKILQCYSCTMHLHFTSAEPISDSKSHRKLGKNEKGGPKLNPPNGSPKL